MKDREQPVLLAKMYQEDTAVRINAVISPFGLPFYSPFGRVDTQELGGDPDEPSFGFYMEPEAVKELTPLLSELPLYKEEERHVQKERKIGDDEFSQERVLNRFYYKWAKLKLAEGIPQEVREDKKYIQIRDSVISNPLSQSYLWTERFEQEVLARYRYEKDKEVVEALKEKNPVRRSEKVLTLQTYLLFVGILFFHITASFFNEFKEGIVRDTSH